MNRQELIEAILVEKEGVITTADALKHQISKPVFLEYVKQMGLRKMAHGIYASDDAWPDIFRQIQMQYPSVIFSHESSLYLHGMSEREPDPIGYPVRCYNIERTLCDLLRSQRTVDYHGS